MSEEAGLDIDFDQELARLQGAAAGVTELPEPRPEPPAVIEGSVVDDARTVEFMGRRFRVADKIGAMPLLKFSMYTDVSLTDPKGLAAIYAMLRDCIHPGTPGCGTCEACKSGDDEACKDYDPGDWGAFERHAIDTRAGAEDLIGVINRAMELITGRPTEQPPASSGGRRPISGGSTARSSGRRGKGSRR